MSQVKIFLLSPRENWICDRFIHEWCQHGPLEVVNNPYEADVIWMLAGWIWNQLPRDVLGQKPLIVTQHHIVPDKFNESQWRDRDQWVTAYHVPCEKTAEQVRGVTSKPVHVIPFWVNQSIWRPLDKATCRYELNLDPEAFLVGSFQRDTEGSDLKTPKLEKGPDVFCDIVEAMAKKQNNLKVVLAGWRRQYVKKRLEAAGIDYAYYNRPQQWIVEQLYNTLDLYIVSSRWEGGPQAVVECALTETPIVSTHVGLAPEILNPTALYKRSPARAKTDEAWAREKVRALEMPEGFKPFKAMIEEVAQ